MRILLIAGLAAVALAPVSADAQAPRWVAVGQGAGGTVEINRASLTWRAVQRAWWRITYAQPKRDGTVEERHLELIDCNARTSAVIGTVALDAGGQVISDQRDGEELARQRMGPPTPGTTGELVASQACRLRPPPPPPPRKRR